jgi:hypothetical protein
MGEILANGKTPSLDKMPKFIFKTMHSKFHNLLCLFLALATNNNKNLHSYRPA